MLGAIHKRRPRYFAYPPCPQVSAGVRILPSSRTFGVRIHKIRRNLYCVVNFLRDSERLISHFLDEWKICKVKRHKLQYILYIYTF